MDDPCIGASVPSGSGAVKSLCKSLSEAREKQTGMRWTRTGAHAVATLRALQASGAWPLFWTHTPQGGVCAGRGARGTLTVSGPRCPRHPDSGGYEGQESKSKGKCPCPHQGLRQEAAEGYPYPGTHASRHPGSRRTCPAGLESRRSTQSRPCAELHAARPTGQANAS
jgi:hypothetical protein